MSTAPQDRTELQPIVDAVRVLDSALDIVWNPCGKVVQAARYSAVGTLVPAVYDGRWEVRRTLEGRRDRVREADTVLVYQLVDDAGGYKPVGWWLVDFLQQWDSQNADFRARWDAVWAENDRLHEADGRMDDGAIEEAVHQMAHGLQHEGGRTIWIGQGADFSPSPERIRARMGALDGETTTGN